MVGDFGFFDSKIMIVVFLFDSLDEFWGGSMIWFCLVWFVFVGNGIVLFGVFEV